MPRYVVTFKPQTPNQFKDQLATIEWLRPNSNWEYLRQSLLSGRCESNSLEEARARMKSLENFFAVENLRIAENTGEKADSVAVTFPFPWRISRDQRVFLFAELSAAFPEISTLDLSAGISKGRIVVGAGEKARQLMTILGRYLPRNSDQCFKVEPVGCLTVFFQPREVTQYDEITAVWEACGTKKIPQECIDGLRTGQFEYLTVDEAGKIQFALNKLGIETGCKCSPVRTTTKETAPASHSQPAPVAEEPEAIFSPNLVFLPSWGNDEACPIFEKKRGVPALVFSGDYCAPIVEVPANQSRVIMPSLDIVYSSRSRPEALALTFKSIMTYYFDFLKAAAKRGVTDATPYIIVTKPLTEIINPNGRQEWRTSVAMAVIPEENSNASFCDPMDWAVHSQGKPEHDLAKLIISALAGGSPESDKNPNSPADSPAEKLWRLTVEANAMDKSSCIDPPTRILMEYPQGWAFSPTWIEGGSDQLTFYSTPEEAIRAVKK